MKTESRRGFRLAMAWIALAGLVALAVGCATARPGRQSFLRIDTPHFEIVSARGREETIALARSLELFHAGCLALFGLETTPPGHGRTRVLAFDDRTLGRPYGVGGAASYLVPTVDQAELVFRVPGDWSERTSRSLRADYARRLLRSVSPRRLPLWLEVGLAEVASAIQIRGDEIRLGAVVETHAARIEDWRRSSFEGLLRTAHLADASARERALFEAQAFSLVHALVFGPSGPASPDAGFPRAYLEAWHRTSGSGLQAAQDRELLGGDGEALADRVHAHLSRDRFPMRILRPFGWELDELGLRPVPQGDVEVLLGELAWALGREAEAGRAFERALRQAPDHPRARVGLARRRVGEDFEEAERLAQRAARAAERDARVRALVGRIHLQGVAAAGDEAERRRRAREARRHLRASLTLDESSASVRLDLAKVATHLQEWEEAEAWLQAAGRRRPGALAVDLALARLQWSRGWDAAARLQARDVLSRTSWHPFAEEARRYLQPAP